MPLYMFQFAYTSESWAAQISSPQNRIDTVAPALCETAGGKLVGAWLCFGDYDGVFILDMPNVESMAAVALAIAGGGAVKSSKTTVLMTGAQGVDALKKAETVSKGYQPAR
jgi:uncharacterized protein with GYD domain